MPDLHFTTDIEGPAEPIFALIADIAHYDRWLPSSESFGAVTQISSAQVGLGTTFVDSGPNGEMHGSVTEFHPSTSIAFQQSTPIKLPLLRGTVDIRTRYTLEPEGQATRVNREVKLQVRGSIKVVQFLVAAAIKQENERILQKMKYYVENGRKAPEDVSPKS